MKKIFAFLVVAGLVIGGGGIASAVTLFDRGLPNLNLNDAAGSSRSNVTWASTNPTGFMGDDFVIGTTGQSYVINSITVWGAQYDPLSTDINNISLYVGKAGGSLGLLSTGSVSGNTNSNPNIIHTYVSYPAPGDPLGYQGNSGGYYPIAQTIFNGLNLLVDGGVKYNFGVLGDKNLWWSHASNAALSGTPQDGADGKYLEFDTANLASVVVWDSSLVGWDKGSDINVQIAGAPVPIPGALLLFGSGLLGLVGIGRKRLRK
jgi:hypothetical protein